MKKLCALIAFIGLLYLTSSNNVFAQDSSAPVAKTETKTPSPAQKTVAYAHETVAVQPKQSQSIHNVLKQKFIEGGPGFMTSILICLILGLAIAIERVVYLNLASTNNKKLLERIEEALNTGGIEAAKKVCRNTKGPVARIFYHGLDRSHEGLEVVEKTVVAYGTVQTSLLEKGLIWIALFITLGPIIGFLGTVIGIVHAFDAFEVAGDFSPSLVAMGIKMTLITTIAGLIVAMILQVFYNYSISKIESIVNGMEDASISLIDILVKFNSKK